MLFHYSKEPEFTNASILDFPLNRCLVTEGSHPTLTLPRIENNFQDKILMLFISINPQKEKKEASNYDRTW